jgi:hypothetical protein
MTLTELQAAVYTLTNRPDLTAETLLAVQAATLKWHQTDYYYKDIFETGIVFSTSDFEQSLDYRTLIPIWRALKYLRKSDSTGDDTKIPFDIILPENILDDYSLNRTDVCYVAGANLQIKSSTAFQYALLGCYVNPNITISGYSSWIALDHPFAIIYEAAADVFRQIGKLEEMAAFKVLANEQLVTIQRSNILAQGY